ncbi:hypothetical protein DVV91_17055 [Clostridium botulinum]|uniref:hypothetical protein n=1 Tax=Clostridium botulinum TaxID=1491 RepID=UPI0019679AFB|nr:hypothetical protein [Clostridium botulinum]MBN1076032.1 hypothetical protein [Clostridium botulinum]
MKDCKFKQLILDVYGDWKSRSFEKIEFGCKCTYNNYFGFLYNAVSTDSLDKIIDINKYMDIANPDMLMLHSRITNEEIEIYQWDLKDYTIKNDVLNVQFNNGKNKEFKL